jgi:hypothetical protein
MLVVVRILAAAGTLAMATAIVFGFATASFTEDGGALLGLVWGRVTLLDIYLAFLFGWLWIAWRERSVARSTLWLLATIVTGSLALFAYLLGASLRANDVAQLVVGPHRRAEVAALGSSAAGADR